MKVSQKALLILIFICTWFSLIEQFNLNINSNLASTTELVIRFFSYFTILSNVLVAVCATVLLFNKSNVNSFFASQSTQTAIAVYIFVVGLIYNVILRSIWDPQGIQKLIDELLHVVNPFLFILYWAIFSTQNKLKSNVIRGWLLYPFFYVIFVLIRGNFSGFYPYPFFHVKEIGLNKVLINCFAVFIIFVIASFLFLIIGNMVSKSKNKISV